MKECVLHIGSSVGPKPSLEHECAHKQEEDATAQALSGTMCVADEMEFVREAQIASRERHLFIFQGRLGDEYLYLQTKKTFQKKNAVELWNSGDAIKRT